MAEGQELGPKASYVYTSDNGTEFVILRDTTLALTTATGLTLFTPGSGFGFTLPRRFRPRGVYWIGVGANNRVIRKFIICGTVDSVLYSSDSSLPLTIDGIAGFTTSRYGEQYQYIRQSVAVPTP